MVERGVPEFGRSITKERKSNRLEFSCASIFVSSAEHHKPHPVAQTRVSDRMVNDAVCCMLKNRIQTEYCKQLNSVQSIIMI
jgi:hypothetical protein